MISNVLGLDGNSMAKALCSVCVNEGLIVRVLVAPLFGLSSMVGWLMNLGVVLPIFFNASRYIHYEGAKV
uniref:Uncharacterized protein n=1 Tax=Helianthus annuus TaxID=4232 RepID=A0A251TBT0_HELAN